MVDKHDFKIWIATEDAPVGTAIKRYLEHHIIPLQKHPPSIKIRPVEEACRLLLKHTPNAVIIASAYPEQSALDLEAAIARRKLNTVLIVISSGEDLSIDRWTRAPWPIWPIEDDRELADCLRNELFGGPRRD